MKGNMKRFLAILIATLMLWGSMPLSAMAELVTVPSNTLSLGGKKSVSLAVQYVTEKDGNYTPIEGVKLPGKIKVPVGTWKEPTLELSAPELGVPGYSFNQYVLQGGKAPIQGFDALSAEQFSEADASVNAFNGGKFVNYAGVSDHVLYYVYERTSVTLPVAYVLEGGTEISKDDLDDMPTTVTVKKDEPFAASAPELEGYVASETIAPALVIGDVSVEGIKQLKLTEDGFFYDTLAGKDNPLADADLPKYALRYTYQVDGLRLNTAFVTKTDSGYQLIEDASAKPITVRGAKMTLTAPKGVPAGYEFAGKYVIHNTRDKDDFSKDIQGVTALGAEMGNLITVYGDKTTWVPAAEHVLYYVCEQGVIATFKTGDGAQFTDGENEKEVVAEKDPKTGDFIVTLPGADAVQVKSDEASAPQSRKARANQAPAEAQIVGWSDEENATEPQYQPGEKVRITESKTFYAMKAKGFTVTFEANGGKGETYTLTTDEDGRFVFPTPEAVHISAKDGNVFAGWSTNRWANSSNGYVKASIYQPGAVLTITKGETYYAIWGKKDATGIFYIRLDGKIPHEPGNYPAKEYTEGITISGALKAESFFTDSGSGVDRYLNAKPTDDQIKAVYDKYDSKTQYVRWYVIKPSDTYHVDGVLLNKAKVSLTYDPNCEMSEYKGQPPIGGEWAVGQDVNVEKATELSRQGYTFVHWSTDKNDNGTAYEPGSTIKMNENTTLYAIWQANDGIK
ncbi:MAG: InlB B-repeat-containing protein, partial [Clostridia bacterium]